MKQQCSLWTVWLTWLAIPAIALLMGLLQSWRSAGIVLLVGIVAQILYVRCFPYLSHILGYGSVKDAHAAPADEQVTGASRVVFYSANLCPFCPIVRERLLRLKSTLGFELDEVDLTFRPQIALEKGFRSVPAVEYEGEFLFGNATSAELVAFLRGVTEGAARLRAIPA